MSRHLAAVALSFVCVLCACGGGDSGEPPTSPSEPSTGAPTATRTASPTADATGSPSPSATVEATPTPEPTATATQPAAPAATLPPTAVPTATTTPAPASAAVSVADDYFAPVSAEVRAGGTVTWTWTGDGIHDVTAQGLFDSGQQLGAGYQFSFTFPAAGTFQYKSELHDTPPYQTMRGTITVR